jgi:hypothetical protein
LLANRELAAFYEAIHPAGLLAIMHDFERVSLQKSLQCDSNENPKWSIRLPLEVNPLAADEGPNTKPLLAWIAPSFLVAEYHAQCAGEVLREFFSSLLGDAACLSSVRGSDGEIQLLLLRWQLIRVFIDGLPSECSLFSLK